MHPLNLAFQPSTRVKKWMATRAERPPPKYGGTQIKKIVNNDNSHHNTQYLVIMAKRQHGRTMHKIMSDALGYEKHLACMKGWLSDRAKAHRQEWATVIYGKYPKPED